MRASRCRRGRDRDRSDAMLSRTGEARSQGLSVERADTKMGRLSRGARCVLFACATPDRRSPAPAVRRARTLAPAMAARPALPESSAAAAASDAGDDAGGAVGATGGSSSTAGNSPETRRRNHPPPRCQRCARRVARRSPTEQRRDRHTRDDAGTVATYSCATATTSPRSRVTCEDDGAWNSEPPSCAVKDCGALTAPPTAA